MASKRQSKTLVFSYKRFSSKSQGKGTSIARQTKMARDWVSLQKGMELSDLNFTDSGISGFDGSNVRKGALGQFLELVRTREIPKGSILVIEQWDRLTRQNPMDAIPLVRDILKAGVQIQTLYPEQRYTEQSTRDSSGMLLMQMVFTLLGSYAESAKKSDRIRKAWQIKRDKISKGKPVKLGKLPPWITQNKETLKMEVVEEKAKVVKLIYDLHCNKGWSQYRILNHLVDEGIPPISEKQRNSVGHWHRTFIGKLLHNEAVLGCRNLYRTEMLEDGSRVRVKVPEARQEKLFPAIISKKLWEKAQVNTESAIPRGREGYVALFSLGMLRCARCGEKMLVTYKGDARRWICKGATQRTTSCTNTGSYPAHELEMNFLRYVSEIDVSKFGDNTAVQKSVSNLEARRQRITQEVDKVQKSYDQILTNMSDPDLVHLMSTWKKQERSTSVKLRNLSGELRDVDIELRNLSSSTQGLRQLKRLSSIIHRMDWKMVSKDDRRQLREVISGQVKRIVVYTYRNQEDFPNFRGKRKEWVKFLQKGRLSPEREFQKKLRCAWVEFSNGEWRILRGIEKYYDSASHAVKEPRRVRQWDWE